jgi:poly(A)-specific ribonuclease
VGHNCFLDLVYIYRTFIDELPDTVEEFQERIHKLWPIVVDTKYMSTHNCGDINPVSSLEQIAEELSNEKTPILEVDKEHKKYEEVANFHEAGYDSFMTAQIAARLSAKLYKAGTFDDVDDSSSISTEKAITNGFNGLKLTATALNTHNHHVENGTEPPAEPDAFMPSVEGGKWKRRGDPTLPLPADDDPFEYNPVNLNHHHHDAELEKSYDGGMPAWSSGFWRVYGNKLRVFGTEEAVCVLDGDDDVLEEGDNGIGQGGVVVA